MYYDRKKVQIMIKVFIPVLLQFSVENGNFGISKFWRRRPFDVIGGPFVVLEILEKILYFGIFFRNFEFFENFENYEL